jgi:pyridoxine 5'-phosphate synthase PdxJ
MKKYITIKELAAFHQIEESYIMEFIRIGIISAHKRKSAMHIHLEDVDELERAIRLRRDLEVNLQGVEIICRLRNRIVQLEEEMALLKRD